MTWQTGTATDYKDLLTKLVQVATGNHVATAVISAAGTGYAVNDILTATGGTFSFAATFRVTTVGGGGAITALVLVNGGAYTVNPSSPVSTTVAPAGGSGATVTVTFAATGWTAVRNTTPGGEKEVILEGIGSGSDLIYVGIKTYNMLSSDAFNTAYNWTCIGMTGFNSGLDFDQQPGASPGGIPTSLGGAYVPLKTSDAFNISFWFSIDGRRIIMVAKVETAVITHYVHCYLGWLNPFGTSSEFPYPIYVGASSARHDVWFGSTAPNITGLTEVVGLSGKTGPAYVRTVDSVWRTVRNSVAIDSGSPSRTADRDFVVYPCGQTNLSAAAAADINIDETAIDWDDIIPATGVPGAATYKLQPTPDTGGDKHLLVPATVCASFSPYLESLGELDFVFWLSATGGISSEDTVKLGSIIYRVFQNGNRVTEFSFLALREG